MPSYCVETAFQRMFQASITFAAAQGGIGELFPIDALTVRCRIPRNCSMAKNLNSPTSATAIKAGDSEQIHAGTAMLKDLKEKIRPLSAAA